MHPDEIAALHAFAARHGRCWKQALRDEWMRACSGLPTEIIVGSPFRTIHYRSVLQRLRNDPDFGTRGLGRFRLPEGFWRK